jgi:hypothetical protein
LRSDKDRVGSFVSLPAWHTLHSVGEIVYDGSANDDKSFFRMLPARVADSNSRNAVSFSSARTTKGFPSPRGASTMNGGIS